MGILLFIRPAGPLELGESLSGARALFVPWCREEDWPFLAASPIFKALAAEERETVWLKFPVAVQRYQAFTGSVPVLQQRYLAGTCPRHSKC